MGEDTGGRVVVVTGGTAGVGRATVEAFARRGDRVAVLARGEEGLAETEAAVAALGSEALPIRTDVADAAAVERAAAQTEERFGPIDVWVNNAMTTVFSRFLDITPEEYRRVTEVTYLGQVHGTMAALRRMRYRRSGTIVLVGSALAFQGIPLQTAYCGAKHAVQGFADSLRGELRHEDVPVHIAEVHLPGMNTPQFDWCRTHLPGRPQPVPPILQPEVAADAILWAIDHRRREVLLDDATVKTVLGARLAPWVMPRFVADRAYDSQMADAAVREDRPDNLFEPAPGPRSARGRFDDATAGEPDAWWRLPSGALASATGAVAAALGSSVRLVRRS